MVARAGAATEGGRRAVMLEPVQPHDRVLILGKTGSGKSNTAKELLKRELDGGARIVAFDPHDEYSRRGRLTSHVRLGPLRDRCTAEALLRDPALLDVDALSLAVVPSLDPQRCAQDFEAVAGLVQETGDLLLVVEEVGHFEQWAAPKLQEVACQFRHYGVAVVFVAQCAVMVPKKARRQMSQLYSGRQDDPDDLDAIARITKDPDFAARVSRLPRGELLHWRDDFEQRKEEPKCLPA